MSDESWGSEEAQLLLKMLLMAERERNALECPFLLVSSLLAELSLLDLL